VSPRCMKTAALVSCETRLVHVFSQRPAESTRLLNRPVVKPRMPLPRSLSMILGMTPFTLLHVIISLIGILSGLSVVFGLIGGRRMDDLTALFLITTFLTSLTGFLFPFQGFKPSYVLGILSIIVLAIAIYARYARRMAGGWRRTYVISASIALYFN